MCVFILEVGTKTHSEISDLAKVMPLIVAIFKPSFILSQFKYFPVSHALKGPLASEVIKSSYSSKMSKA